MAPKPTGQPRRPSPRARRDRRPARAAADVEQRSTACGPGSPSSTASSASAPTPAAPRSCSRSRPGSSASCSRSAPRTRARPRTRSARCATRSRRSQQEASQAAEEDVATLTDRLDALEGRVNTIASASARPRASSVVQDDIDELRNQISDLDELTRRGASRRDTTPTTPAPAELARIRPPLVGRVDRAAGAGQVAAALGELGLEPVERPADLLRGARRPSSPRRRSRPRAARAPPRARPRGPPPSS